MHTGTHKNIIIIIVSWVFFLSSPHFNGFSLLQTLPIPVPSNTNTVQAMYIILKF